MIEIKPAGKIDAIVACPRSKSFTNRALVLAALAKGKSHLSNILLCDDTRRMIDGLRAFGAFVTHDEERAEVVGLRGRPTNPKTDVHVGGSGTCARFLTALAALGARAVIRGDARMSERPMEDLAAALRDLGVDIESSQGCLPVKITRGWIQGGEVSMRGSVSSQFLSALLMVLPYAERESKIHLTDKLASKSYVDMTIEMMREFGCLVRQPAQGDFIVSQGAYKAREYAVQGDAANAAYFFAAAAVTKGRVRVTGIRPNGPQGELKFPDILERMGCQVRRGATWIEVSGGALRGVELDLNDQPDAAQTLAVVAAFAQGRTRVRNVANLRVKETDRLAATVMELRKIGCQVTEHVDGLDIMPGPLKGATIDTYSDHRMAMAFAVAGLALPGVSIKDPSCVSKSFPDFFTRLQDLR
jgi:3-phosphoshikimate 1-carboxyvinyltransferase